MSWTLHLLLLLLLAGGIVRADPSSGAHTNVTDGPHSCGGVDVPYPFGIADRNNNGDFRAGFAVVCENGKPVLPTGGDGVSIPFDNFSIKTAEARVWLPVGWQRYSSSGQVVDYEYMTFQAYTESVYRISNTRNNLFVLGCNTLGFLGSQPNNKDDTSYAQYTGCFSYCNDSQSAVNGSCSGIGCCHADIPSDLVDNDVFFDDHYNHSHVVDFSPWDYAFVAEKENYTFNTGDLKRNLRQTPWSMPVVLDWAIRGDNLTCNEAKKKKKEEYACKSSNSLCLNATNGPGYICKCRKGYEGNPYVTHGCTDINECERLGPHYHCKGVCRNKQGSYECTCPKHTSSANPYKEDCRADFSRNAKIIVGAFGVLIIGVILLFIFLLRKEKRKMRDYYDKNGGPTLEKLNNIKLYKKDDIRKIQKSCNIIGQGGFGKVYKGCIGNDTQLVAVKEPINVKSEHNDQFANEIIIQSQVIHKNIVKLLGCCLEVQFPVLVYEFVPRGSLDVILHGDKNPLSMGRRLQIAAESAEGLAYMHSKANVTILHGDVKPANILINDDYIPKISDFGISRLIAKDNEHTALVIGDRSYMDPVFFQTGLRTNKSDVYSFGVVLLELITRKKASHSNGQNELLMKFNEAYVKEKSLIGLVDKELLEVDPQLLQSLTEMIHECLSLDVNERPDMTDLEQRLRDMVKRFPSTE